MHCTHIAILLGFFEEQKGFFSLRNCCAKELGSIPLPLSRTDCAQRRGTFSAFGRSVGLFFLSLHPISPTHFAIQGAFPLPPPFCARGTLQARETGVGGGGGIREKEEEEEEGTRDKPPPSEFVWGILELESGRGLLRSHSFFFPSLVPFLFQRKTSLPLPFFSAPIQDAFEGHVVFPTIDFCNKQ